jgi:peroxiredoxin
MAIQVAQKFPNVSVKIATRDGAKDILTSDFFAGKKVILFALPGAFTPVCSKQHLPDFAANRDALDEVGIDRIVCLSVNDPFVMQAWAENLKVDGIIDMMCDGDGQLTRRLDMEIDLSEFGLGVRSKRYAMILENGIITNLQIEESPLTCTITSAQYFLDFLSKAS